MKKPKATQKTKKQSKNVNKVSRGLLALIGIAGIVVGIVAGYYIPRATPVDPRYELASKADLRSAQDAIASKFMDLSSTGCTDDSDPISPSDRIEVFTKYLKVNKYANRAVIRGCNDIDTLLAKNPVSGNWEETTINISLDTRANKTWQHECLIDDITKTDTVNRSENETIDVYNFVGCRQLLEREQVYNMITRSGSYKSSEVKEKDISSYIKGAEEFSSY